MANTFFFFSESSNKSLGRVSGLGGHLAHGSVCFLTCKMVNGRVCFADF